MLQASKTSVWKNRYEIRIDGRSLVTWDGSWWRAGGRFGWDGHEYQVRANRGETRYELLAEDGSVAARADRVGRKRWTVTADGDSFQFQRVSIWRQEEELQHGGRRVGSVKRTSTWRSDAVADLPGLSRPVQIFVLAVVLTMWDRTAAAAAIVVTG